MTTANAGAIIEHQTPPGAPWVPHTGVINNRDPIGFPVGQPIDGGPGTRPTPESRPSTNSIAYALRPDEQTWQSDRPLSGWHGIVQRSDVGAHVGVMEPDYTPHPTARRAPTTPWDLGTEFGYQPVVF